MITTQYAAMADHLGATAITYPTVYNGALGITTGNRDEIQGAISLGGAALVGGLAAFMLASRGRGWAAVGAGLGAAAGGFIAGVIANQTLPASI